jgi:hypothetical protein
MKKRGLLGGSSYAVPAPELPAPPDPARVTGKNGGTKPIATIGTMQRDATPAQRRAHHMLKMKMKRMAAAVRLKQSTQEKE